MMKNMDVTQAISNKPELKNKNSKTMLLSIILLLAAGNETRAEPVWGGFESSLKIPVSITSSHSGYVTTTVLNSFSGGTGCINGTPHTPQTWNHVGTKRTFAAGTNTYYLSTTGKIAIMLCPSGNTRVLKFGGTTPLITSNGACSTSGCAIVTCSGTGVISNVTSSTLAATCP